MGIDAIRPWLDASQQTVLAEWPGGATTSENREV